MIKDKMNLAPKYILLRRKTEKKKDDLSYRSPKSVNLNKRYMKNL